MSVQFVEATLSNLLRIRYEMNWSALYAPKNTKYFSYNRYSGNDKMRFAKCHTQKKLNLQQLG